MSLSLIFDDDADGRKRCDTAWPDTIPPTKVDYSYTLRTRYVNGTLRISWRDADTASVRWSERFPGGTRSGTGELARSYGNTFEGTYSGDFSGSWELSW